MSIPENPEREDRITYEIVVDCYNETEVAMGWYYYLESSLLFPFEAKVIGDDAHSLSGQTIRVTSMADTDDCEDAIFVIAENSTTECLLQLENLALLAATEKTSEAVDDWKYWVKRGYRF
ncbi:MAG: calcium-binding protein [Opitutaceae bacterium]